MSALRSLGFTRDGEHVEPQAQSSELSRAAKGWRSQNLGDACGYPPRRVFVSQPDSI